MFRTYFTSSFSGLPGTIVFRGYIDCSANPDYPAAISGDMYVVSVAGRIGGASGAIVEVGDQITCITDNAGGTQIAVGNDWSIAQANITYVPENAALKDTANGYAGLTSFKINFLNFLGTFTSFLQNTNTASRLYSFQDRDGTIADNTDLALKQDLSGKDANNGYTGLTLLKINFKNAANTFTSFFTNTNTASRTYTFQDRTDTIADLTDIAGVMTLQTFGNLVNSAISKTTPVDTDMLPLMDSAATNITKKLSWANVKATLNGVYEVLINKDATGGYVGLTLFKINFKNAANTFTSFFTNSNTAARTYSFQDRDGTIADDTDLALKQNLSAKDASGGYVGLTLFKHNFLNALGTFTSFFTNANTATRTYTFQDRDGTIADNTDLAGKQTTALTNGNILIGNGSNLAASVAVTGDVTISNAGVTAIGTAKVTEAMQVLANNITNDVSTSKHGYAPILPNDATKFLNGVGAYAVPATTATPMMIVQEQQANNTNAGTATLGSWETRAINTSMYNTIPSASLASNQITLPAGTYHISGFLMNYFVNQFQGKLRNISDSTDDIISSNGVAGNTYSAQTHSFIEGVITIASSKVFEFQQQVDTTIPTVGMGVAVNFGLTNIYASLTIRKIG